MNNKIRYNKNDWVLYQKNTEVKMNKINRSKTSIAIMGGTFDPIHYGHLVTAEAVRDKFSIDKILFVPTGMPPHKDSSSITISRHRHLMTILATSTNPFFEVSSVEIDRKGITYTIDTIKILKEIYGDNCDIYFITGADALLELETWYKLDELLSVCKFVAATRPGFFLNDLEQNIKYIKSKYGKDVYHLEVPSLAISSTDIRKRVESGQTIKYLLPESVEQYIIKHKIYNKQKRI